MGAYMSEPVVDKVSHDESGELVSCGASSMQGWRITQEDAHNCIIDYDAFTSLFAVYDGHGGHEVAEYCAQNLPKFLKACEAYQKEDFIKALKECFIEFDKTLATPEVVGVLKQIADNKKSEKNQDTENADANDGLEEDDEEEDEEENVKNLFEEAEMPLEQVIAKYQNGPVANRLGKKLFQSPCVRRQKEAGCSKDESSEPAAGCSGSPSKSLGCSRSPSKTPGCSGDAEVSSSSSGSRNQVGSSMVNGTSEEGSNSVDDHVSSVQDSEHVPDSSGDSCKLVKKDKNISESDKPEVNGSVTDDRKLAIDESGGNDVSSSSVPAENGDIVSDEGKVDKISSTVESAKGEKKLTGLKLSALKPRIAAALYRSLLRAPTEMEEDDDEEGDESFEGEDSSEDDAEDNEAENSKESEGDEGGDEEEEEEEEENAVDDDDEDDDEEEEDFEEKILDEPGADSGCTAVVALLRGRELYVANAGDSRCVVCRKGQAIEMSLDHKPEDEVEMERIEKAGGKVTNDGRVNGGLNLSRALGDHAYKQNAQLPLEEQMITALPDVRTLLIDPEEDEFMVLACDGIWNFMSSQEVVDFIRPHVVQEDLKLSQICEKLFDHCLAPNTLGDGTGCDNMTAVIVKFQPGLASVGSKTLKRRAVSDDESEEMIKRSKTEETDNVSVTPV